MLVIRELFSEGDEAVSEIICFCVHLLMGGVQTLHLLFHLLFD